MKKINKAWHLKNKIPRNPSLAERIKWHEGHAKNCACRDSRPMIANLKARVKKKKTGQSNKK